MVTNFLKMIFIVKTTKKRTRTYLKILYNPLWNGHLTLRNTNYTLVESQPLWASSKRVFVCPENQNWNSQRTCALLTLFNNHHHHLHHTAAWVPFISRFESTVRTLTLRKTKMDEVNSLKKNPIQRHSSNNYTSLSHFTGCHFMPYLGRRPSCSGRT